MVALPVVEATNRALAARAGSSRPFVAVFTGGTAGIGANGVLGLATTFGQVQAGTEAARELRVYIVGRSQTAAEALIAACRSAHADGHYEFVQAADLSLLADVDRVCEAVIAAETAAAAASRKDQRAPHVDLLVASQGVLALQSQQTAEGLDFVSALAYYGRMRVVDRLLPLLTAGGSDSSSAFSAGSSSPGHVVSVFNPSLEGAVVESDLGLLQPQNQGIRVRGGQIAALTTFFMEALAARHPGRLALAHYYPGYVVTDLASKSPLPGWAKLLWRLVAPLARFLAVPDAECGQRLLFLASSEHYPAGAGDGGSPPTTAVAGADGTVASGAYRVNWNGDALRLNGKTVPQRAKGMAETVYAHTQEVFASVQGG